MKREIFIFSTITERQSCLKLEVKTQNEVSAAVWPQNSYLDLWLWITLLFISGLLRSDGIQIAAVLLIHHCKAEAFALCHATRYVSLSLPQSQPVPGETL